MKRLLYLTSMVFGLCLAFLLVFGTAQAAPAPVSSAVSPAQAAATDAVTVTAPATVTVPFLEEWQKSGHANTTAEAFNHWNNADPKAVPVECAKCHSTPGYQDFLGADGSAPDKVDQAAPIGTVVECVACHNDKTMVLDKVTMPSGQVIEHLGREARCMECHQGRESKVSVDKAIADAGADADTVSDKLAFKNIHYFASAVAKTGTLGKGGYEYDGKPYDGMFMHTQGYAACTDCHNPHSSEVKVEECKKCHEKVQTKDDLKNIRMAGSEADFNGNGDVEEGIAAEIAGLQEILLKSIQAYAGEVAGKPIAYSADSYPYFFIDANTNGTVDKEEANAKNGFNAWTPRLLKAAYNYQTSVKDPGAYAHGGKYIIELLYDSIDDLNAKIKEPVDMKPLHRTDPGHFNGSAEAFRHWDADGEVPAACVKCHTAGGVPMFLKNGATIAQQPANGLECTTCHSAVPDFKQRFEVKNVKFPSGAVIDSGDSDTNLCMTCHQGRESTVSVNKAIGDAPDDTVKEGLNFINPHYFASGATRYGTEAKGAYEYKDKQYAGFFDHKGVNKCTECHKPHTGEVDWQSCTECHNEVQSPEDLQKIRYTYGDYNGNGDDKEGLYFEIDGMRQSLYTAIQKYAQEKAGKPIVYVGTSYPYFFVDANGNGQADPDEIKADNGYKSWTPRLLRAAYNYQYSGKDPGSFAHNGKYIVQTLYDSIQDIGGDVSAMTRPE